MNSNDIRACKPLGWGLLKFFFHILLFWGWFFYFGVILNILKLYNIFFLSVSLILLCFDSMDLKSKVTGFDFNTFYIAEVKPFFLQCTHTIFSLTFFIIFFVFLIEMARCLLGGSDRVRVAAEWCDRILSCRIVSIK